MKFLKWSKEVWNQISNRMLNLDKKEKIVRKIVIDVKKNRDKSLFYYTKKFDRVNLNGKNILVTKEEIKSAYRSLSKRQIGAINSAAANIKKFCKKQLTKGWQENGLGELTIPLERIGCYIPSGNFPLPSTALMTVVPAKVAGVREIIICTPPKIKDGKVIADESIVVAADMAGANKIFKIGGAQAIAALAFGTENIPKVDKIVGPGNTYVATAKKLVYGYVDIDFIAGPTELLVVADETANSDWIVADLKAEAEHGKDTVSVLATNSQKIASEVKGKMKSNERMIILTKNLEESLEAANKFAPEHLELFVKNPEKCLKKIKNAGSVFLGNFSTSVFGDYTTGTNHVLPTNGLARSRGGLSVRDFIKFVSYQKISKAGCEKMKNTAVTLARLEKLENHAKSVEVRCTK